MDDRDQPGTAGAARTTGGLSVNRLGTWDIVFFVVSAAAPLTVVVSAGPMSLRLGGIGAPGAMLLCAIILILFALGFTAMSKHVRNAGAFYAYVGRGLGKPAGIGVAFVTTFAYVFLALSFYGFIGFFAQSTFADVFGIDLPWGVWAGLCVAIVGFLGFRQVDVGAKVLAVLLTAEVAILLVLAVAVLIQGGPEPVSFESFTPGNVLFGPTSGALFVVGFGAYLGFEGTAIYAEEAKRPERSVPRATYIAIAFLGVFYAFTFWILTVAFGVDGVLALAGSDGFETMVFDGTLAFVGPWAAVTMQVLIVTSFFACLLAFHNASSRYLFSLGREGILPRALARTSRTSGAPFVASSTMTVVSAIAIIIAVVVGADPYLGFALWTYATGVQGLVFAQAVAAVAVIGFFARNRRGESVWRVLIAPCLGAIGLIVGFALIVTNFEIVTGLEGTAINVALLLPTPVLFLVGIIVGLVLRRRNRTRYDGLTQSVSVVDDAEEEPHVASREA